MPATRDSASRWAVARSGSSTSWSGRIGPARKHAATRRWLDAQDEERRMRGTRTAWIGLVVAWLLVGGCAPAPAAPAAPARPAATVAAPAAAPTPPAAPEAAPAAPAAPAADSPAAGAARTLEQELAAPDVLLQAARREGKLSMIHAID